MINMQVKEGVDVLEEKISTIQDGAQMILICSSCAEELVALWLTRPNEKHTDGALISWTVYATCCYCGDRSFDTIYNSIKTTITTCCYCGDRSFDTVVNSGTFQCAGIYESDDEYAAPLTSIINQEIVNDKVKITTERNKK